MNSLNIEKLYIDISQKENPFCQEIVERLQNTPIEYIDEVEARRKFEILELTQGKRTIWLTRFKGNQAKLCPGTEKSYICCNYHVVNETTNCPLECTYCILQVYLNNPVLTVYVNIDDMFDDIQKLIDTDSDRIWRIGTGELADSLALDHITQLSKKLVERFAKTPNLLFELKTKTVNTLNLPDPGPKNFVISWSLNPDSVTENEEHKTAKPEDRLVEAKKMQEKGYLLGFHFDPIIYHQGWKKNYHSLIEMMKKYLDPKRIAWISMGSFRYPPALKEVIAKRFPKSDIIYAEQVQGLDGKTRYVRHLREEMYKSIYNQFMEWDKDLFIYFCMESDVIWQKVMGKIPADAGEVDYMFAESLQRRFPELAFRAPNRENYRDDR